MDQTFLYNTVAIRILKGLTENSVRAHPKGAKAYRQPDGSWIISSVKQIDKAKPTIQIVSLTDQWELAQIALDVLGQKLQSILESTVFNDPDKDTFDDVVLLLLPYCNILWTNSYVQ